MYIYIYIYIHINIYIWRLWKSLHQILEDLSDHETGSKWHGICGANGLVLKISNLGVMDGHVLSISPLCTAKSDCSTFVSEK